jgi:hypothetical protein
VLVVDNFLKLQFSVEGLGNRVRRRHLTMLQYKCTAAAIKLVVFNPIHHAEKLWQQYVVFFVVIFKVLL